MNPLKNKMYDYENFTIAVDFDDTCVRATKAGYCYPKFGPNIPNAVHCLRDLSKKMRIILWTCREGEALEEAVAWFEDNEIPLFGINNNPDPYWVANPTHKIYADVYIDDNNVAIPVNYCQYGECRLRTVAWERVYELVMRQFNDWDNHKKLYELKKANDEMKRKLLERFGESKE